MGDILSTPHDDEIDLFAEIIKAEHLIESETALARKASFQHDQTIAETRKRLETLWEQMRAHMKATGQIEMILPGDAVDYKLAYRQGSKSVDVPDLDAVPKKFIRVKKEADKKKIGDFLKKLPEGEQVNWATIKTGEPTLEWKAVKKGKHEDVEA